MLKKLRFYLILVRAYFRRDKKKIALGISVFLVAALAFKVLVPAILPQIVIAYREYTKPLFVEGVVGKPTYPNPLFDSTETQKDISRLVFNGLMKIGKDGNLVPDLAESYKLVSDTEYLFYLKKNIYWHDGKKFTASDVVYTVSLAQNPAYQSVLEANFKDITVEKVDDYTVKFKLKEPFAPFIYMTNFGIIPAHISLKQYKPIGTGSFKVKKIDKDSLILTSEKMNLMFKFFTTLEQARLAFKLRQIHAIGGISPQEIENLNNLGGLKVYSATMARRQVVVFFNTRDQFLKDRHIRQALAYSIDKVQITQKAGGGKAVAAYNQLPLVNWVTEGKERYPYDPAKARKILESADFSFVSGKLVNKKGENLKLIITNLDDPELNSVSNFLKNYWRELGVEVETKYVSAEKLRKDILPARSFQILINFQEVPVDPDQYVMWHTTQLEGGNITLITSPKLDKLLEDGRRVIDKELRKEKYKLFTTLLLDELPAIFLYYPQYNWLVSDNVLGVDIASFSEPVDRFSSYKNWVFKKEIF